MGISGVLDGADIESKCARRGSSALQKSQTLRWSVTSISASAERVLPRNKSSVAEAGHAAVFRNGVVVLEAIIRSSLRFNVSKRTIHPVFQRFPPLFPNNFANSHVCKKMLPLL
jgi:hypothetical protein